MKNPKTNVAKYLISILMIGIGFGVYAEAVISNPTSLRVGSSNSFPPINMIDSDGELTGFGRDLSDAVLESIGVRPERKHSSVWTDVLDWLDKGEIDFIHDTGYTKDRDAYLDYTRPIIEMPEMIFVRNENLDINTLDSLNGKVVACVNKHITHLYLKQYPQIKCHIVYKPVEGLYALMGGTVDAFVYPREIVMYFAQNLRVSDKVKMVGEPLRYLSWSMTVKEGNSEVVTLLNEGIQKIHKNGEYERIYNKWFGKRLLAGYTQAEVRIIIIAVVVLSLFAGISLALLIYNRRLTNARDALEQSEKKYSEIASSIPGAVFQIGKTGDQEFRLNFISQGIAKEIGVSSNKLLGSIDNFIMYICADDRSRFMQSLEDSILAEVPWNIEFRIETVSGGMMWFGA
ncbi:MAG: transporter substrate-binding domain-containing protein, partial [Gammaproteobacteria bacterium]|nr:transporter substrate-binding domain-containing protein [Gammaproteobacteria bacterium]